METIAAQIGLERRPRALRRKKWRFAGKTARQTDGRWSKEILDFILSSGIGRCVGRPLTRWADELVKYAGGNWFEAAADEHFWAVLEEGFLAS